MSKRIVNWMSGRPLSKQFAELWAQRYERADREWTPYGAVTYHMELAGPSGASFWLFWDDALVSEEAFHKQAEAFKANHDVVGFFFIKRSDLLKCANIR